MKKLLSLLTVVTISTVIAFALMLPSVASDLAQKQANETIFQQSVRIATLDTRLSKAQDSYQTLVYEQDRREKLLVDAAEKIQKVIDDNAELETELDELKAKMRDAKTEVKSLQAKIKNLQKKLLKLTPAASVTP